MNVTGYPIVRLAGILACAAIASACKPLEPAPRDLDALYHRFWTQFDDGTDEDLQEDVRALLDVIDEASIVDEPGRFEPSRLSVEEQAEVDLATAPPPDPALARGVATTTRYRCAMDTLTELLVFPDQNSIYGKYDAYERRFDGDTAPFVAGDVATTGWEGTITASIPLVGTYTYDFRPELRRVPGPEELDGDVIIARTNLIAPAVWTTEKPSFTQDYQIEVYYPFEGDVLHVYGTWRAMDLAALGDMESDTVVGVTVQQMYGWDDITEETCASGLP